MAKEPKCKHLDGLEIIPGAEEGLVGMAQCGACGKSEMVDLMWHYMCKIEERMRGPQ